MIIEYEGESYPFDFGEITIKQAMKIERHAGMPFKDWGKKVAEGGDLKAMQAVGWLILFGGRDTPIEDCDFKLARLGEAFANAALTEQEAAKAAEAAQPGPTAAAISSAPREPLNGEAADQSPLSLAADS